MILKENKFENALEHFKRVQKIFGARPGRCSFILFSIIKYPYLEIKMLLFLIIKDISYNIAVCYYKLKQYDLSLKHIADIIEKGIKEHPGKLKTRFSYSND